VVLQAGKIVEQGAPEELFRLGGQFHRLATLQGMKLT
jgi:ABC-type multidrug transport system fused ATPase/permease subunit